MVSIIDNKLTIQFEENVYAEESVFDFIDSIIWYISHLDPQAYSEDDAYFMMQILKAFLPASENIKIPKIKTK